MADVRLTDPPADLNAVVQALAFNNLALRTIFGSAQLKLPGQGAPTIFWGTGVPGVNLGANNDVYLRLDGAAGAFIYQKRAAVWTASGA